MGIPPKHYRVYSCGFICLGTLYSDWKSNIKSGDLCLSVISMLSTASEKMIPPDDK